jgi:hypothetical protein
MKLLPPRVVIDKDDPFRDALFGRKDFALSLTSLIRNAEENLVIFVNAPWGHGKTTFAEMWRAHLRKEKLDAIYYNAYASDYFDDPFVSFSGEILALVKKRLAEAKGSDVSREAFKKAAVEIAKRLVGLGVKVGVKAGSLGVIDATDLKELKDAGVEAASGVSEIAADTVEKRIEHFTREKDTLAVFKDSLGKLAKLFRDEQGFPLTIIVDELDRCRPDFALGLLERIKHLFEVENVAFVLLVNREQIERYVETVYGKNPELAAYLLKFGNVFVDLPKSPMVLGRYVSGSDEFCANLHQYFDMTVPGGDSETVLRVTQVCARHFQLTLREIEKTFTSMALFYASGPHQFSDGFWIPLLSVIKLKLPKLYSRLAAREAGLGEFYEATRLDKFADWSRYSFNEDYPQRFFRFCLTSKEDYEGLPKPERDELKYMFGGRRELHIPSLCAGLDRFSMKLDGGAS